MTWNHRVIKTEGEWEDSYQIHEVYYNEAGRPKACTASSVKPYGESVEELEEECRRFVKACLQPVLDMVDFKKGGKYYSEDLADDWEEDVDES